MKKKFIPLLLVLVLGSQPLLACEWCGHKGAQHGTLMNALSMLAYVMRNFADVHGWNNYQDDQPLDASTDVPPEVDEAREAPALILVPRNEEVLSTLITTAAAGRYVLAVDELMYETQDGMPVPIDGELYYGLEHPIAYQLSLVLCARSLLNGDLDKLQNSRNGENLYDLLEQLFERIETMEFAQTTTSSAATDWRAAFLRDSLFDVTAHWIERLDSTLPQLWQAHDTLPSEQQIPQEDIDFLEEPKSLDPSWTLMLARCWRNFFMARHLKTLQSYAHEQGLTVIAVVHPDHLADLKERLADIGTASTTNPSPLDLESLESEG